MSSYETCGGFFILWIVTFILIRAITGTCPEYDCGDGNCYRMGDICNRIKDCMDGSDEKDCARLRCEEEGKFKCANTGCIRASFVCDGFVDCLDGSDEWNCTRCSYLAFTCHGGGCVHRKALCDGKLDCSDGSDEANCTNKGCSWEQFACSNGQCVPLNDRCDEYTDCVDGSDEIKCTIACDSTAFQCQDGSCIKQDAVCNHHKDCADGRDELNCTEKWSPQLIWEFWYGHGEVVIRRKFMDDNVVFYFDDNVDPSITWPFESISKAWKYVKETYGSFGPNPLLYVVLGSESLNGTHTDSFRERSHGYRNIIHSGLNTPIPLTIKHSIILNELITAFGGVIRKAAKEILNDADNYICGSEMQEILSYDAYKYINEPSEEMENWVESKLKQYKNGIYWFRDWFLPIYEAYGEASVLERFYNLTYNYFRRPTDTMKYSKKLNRGEFVHFWSGASGTDLQFVAQQAFGCYETCQDDLLMAQKKYPTFSYTGFDKCCLTPSEAYEGSNQKLVFADKHIVVYFQSSLFAPKSFYRKISNMWQYFKSHYKPFYHNLPYTIVLNNKTIIDYSCEPLQESQQSKRDSVLHVIICNITRPPIDSDYLDEIAEYIGTLAINRRSETENWWPGFGVSGWTVVSIIVYDIYTRLGYSDHADRWLVNKIKESFSFPRDNTLWFQNWYLQIYNGHGKSQVLIRFLNLLDSSWKLHCGRLLNMGEFVHFWSGATGTNLQTLAENLMGWNVTYQKQLDDARNSLPFSSGFNYTYEDSASDTLKTKSTGEATVVIIIGTLVVFVFGLLVTGGTTFYAYRRKIENLSVAVGKWTSEEIDEFFKGNSNLSETDVNASIYSQPFNKKYQLPRSALNLDEDKVSGSGQFGVVRSGRLADEKQGASDLKVAVKTVKLNVNVAHFKALLSEIKILAHLGKHESIAALLGTVTENIANREVFVVLEFCGKGDLLRYLQVNSEKFQNLFKLKIEKSLKCVDKLEQTAQASVELVSTSSAVQNENSPISTSDLLKWSRQIADGMEYISFKKVVHGDLAARNVLLTVDNIAKISDFGLSRQLHNYSEYRKTSRIPLPWRWLAIESLTKKIFTVHSDVWSYGVTLWEIFTLGKLPYPNRDWNEEFVKELTEGQRLSAPDFGNQEIYRLMLECTKCVPNERVSFAKILSILNVIEANLESNTSPTSTNSQYCTLNGNSTQLCSEL